MPVHKLTQNGEVYYRWGDHGKMYKTKAEAEAQGRAIHAAGYKEPAKQAPKK